jgi:class 3 adenylate cyclase/tetratricopeptide (TPR) repeat protein
MQGLAPSDIFVFEDFRLDRRRGLFRRDDNGAFVPVAIGSRALDILGVLIEQAGEIVSKDDLLSAVWPETVVDYSNLTVQTAALRRVLDRGRSNGSCIQTVSGRGYRFIAPVTRCAMGIDSGLPVNAHGHLWVFSRDGVEPSAPLANERSSEPQPSSTLSAERRQLTVMICDLVGSTMLSSRLDPEDLREIIAAYHRAVSQTVASFDGFVGNYMGDTVPVYFGYPRAHEDDAERAVRAGLGVIDAVARLDLKCAKLQARVGIATGVVVVSEGSAQERSVVGEAPYLAAQLKVLAEPNTVVIAAATRRLLGGLFEYRDLGAVEVAGTAAALPAWQVLRPSAVASRFEALRGSALTPLVGRDEEIDLLLRRWTRAQTGDGQVVLISGEPGIGKSRITAELEGRLDPDPYIRLCYFCSPHHQDSALFPFVDQLAGAAGFAPDDPPPARLEKLEALLARTAPADEDAAFIADLLSLPASGHHKLPNLSPQRKKERTLEALVRRLEGLARQQLVLMVFEDAHWIDPTSRELLDLTIERIRNLQVLLIVTFRPEFQPAWTGQPQVMTLVLNRLDRRDRRALVAQIAGGKELPEEIVDQIVDRTDGVPLFIEELTKSVLESGVPPVGIPTTLHDSLIARLDRLGSVRLVAQIGAAIGRQFPYALLLAVSDLAEDELRAALGRLVASELMFERGTPPDAVYSFKHALVQDAAHGSLLRGNRQQLHARIAEALEAHSPELMETEPELFAQHYAEAGLVEKSVAYWGKAGRRSAARSAMAEAAAQLQKGLDQLALLPDTPERQRRELELRSSQGAVFVAIKGTAAPETERAYARAHELWEQLGYPSGFVQIPYGQSANHILRGDFALAQRLAEGLLRVSRQRGDTAGMVLGHYSAGRNLMFTGKFAAARWHLERALAFYDTRPHSSLVFEVAFPPHVSSQGVLGFVLFCLGYPDQASAQSSAAIAGSRRLAHLPSLVAGLQFDAMRLSLVGDAVAVSGLADELVAVATEQGFPSWAAHGTVIRGWVKVKEGEVAEGISLLRAGSTAHRASGMGVAWTPHPFVLLAEACEIAGEIEDGLAWLDRALHVSETTGLTWLAAELNRRKGHLLLRQRNSDAAEELYGKALCIAQEQQAKMWELRAAISLARLWGEEGRRAESRDLLARVYGWFTEGFDTADLKEARALLDELNDPRQPRLTR